MKKIIFVLLVLPLFVTSPVRVLAEKLAALSEIMKPTAMSLDDDQIYITENITIYIYSLKDFKLKKKFGKPGEGPEEFKNFVSVKPLKEHLLINSMGKVSYFKKDGTFIKELKVGAGMFSRVFFPLEQGFIGRGMTMEDKVIYVTINFFDADLNKGKELYRMKSPQQQGGKIELLTQIFSYRTHENKIYVAGKKGFIIDVLDHTGKPLFSIRQKYEPRQFTAADEKIFRKSLKVQLKEQYEAAKDRIVFPGCFPEIQNFFIADNLIYVSTWKIGNDKVEFFIFDLEGKLVKKLFIPILFQTPLRPYPVGIKNGKLYQLIEKEDEEVWELHVNEIK